MAGGAVRMKRILGLLISALGFSATQAYAQSSEERFRDEMIPRLAKSLPGGTLSPLTDDPLAITVKGGHLDGGQINLNRIYGYCLTASRADCESEKESLIAAVAIKPEAATAETLRLIVRDQEYVDWIREADAKEGKGALTIAKPLGGGLYAVLAYRLSNGVGSITTDNLADLNLTTEQAWSLAQSQTAAILPSVPTADQLQGGVVLFQEHDLGSSLLIDLSGWSKLSAASGPNLVVAVVSDNLVFVGKMADGPDLENLRKTVAEECANQARCISPHLYRFRNGRWAIAN